MQNCLPSICLASGGSDLLLNLQNGKWESPFFRRQLCFVYWLIISVVELKPWVKNWSFKAGRLKEMRIKIKPARHLGLRQISEKDQEEVISQWFLLWHLICSSLTVCCLGLNILKSHYPFLKYWFIYILNECLPSAFLHKSQVFAERNRAVSALSWTMY